LIFLVIAVVLYVYFWHKAKSKWDFFIGNMVGALIIALSVLALS
jgi:Na+/proline symporter